jgi:hypothetical protein
MSDPGASQTQLVAFAHCVQTHGAPNFPEPNGQGVFSMNGINQGSPSFRAATNHCSHLLPNGGRPTAAQEAQNVAQALEFSRCMRAHGIPDFPDPQILNGGADISISLRGGKGSDLDPNDPRFQAAQRACGGPGGGPLGGGPKPSSRGGAK